MEYVVPTKGGDDFARGKITFAIESLNSGFRRLNRGRTIFPNAIGLLKALYLAIWELTKK